MNGCMKLCRFWIAFAALLLGHTLAGAQPAGEQPVKIPLQLVKDEEGHWRVGILVSLGNGTPILCELDTGNAAFYAAINNHPTAARPDWWGNFTPVSPARSGSVKYTSGINYDYQVVQTSVTLTAVDGTRVTAADVEMGRITKGYGGDLGDAGANKWDKMIADNQPPLHGVFWGNFGGRLNGQEGLAVILGQFPGLFGKGFAIHLGEFSHPEPYLMLGVNDAERARYPLAAAMVPLLDKSGQPLKFPHTGLPHYEPMPLRATYRLGNGAEADTLANLPTLFDTGAPRVNIRTSVPRRLVERGLVRDNTPFQMTLAGAGTPDVVLDFRVGQTSSLNEVHVAENNDTDEVNAGLTPYFYFDILYDIEKGVVRFRPRAATAQ